MEIVGNGFLARHLRPISPRHSHAVILAAGVSSASGSSDAEFAREAELLREVAHRCRETGRLLVFFSTASAGMYGAMDGPGTEDCPVAPCTPYGAHKRCLEERLLAYGTDYMVLRLGHVVGPGQPPHQLIPALVRQICAGSVRIDHGAVRDLIGVAEAVTIIDWLLGRDLRGETVNVASGTTVPVEDIVDHLERRLGVVTRRQYRDVGSSHTISIEKLQALVPEVATLGFGPGYYRRVLDSFTASGNSTGSRASATAGAPSTRAPPLAPVRAPILRNAPDPRRAVLLNRQGVIHVGRHRRACRHASPAQASPRPHAGRPDGSFGRRGPRSDDARRRF